jgi:hypothetical protein
MLVSCALAQSQPPTPTPSVGAQSPQKQADPKDGSPNSGNTPVPSRFPQQQGQEPQQGATAQNQQPTTNGWGWFTNNGANWAIVALTFVLTVIGFFQWKASHKANRHNAIIERAYVTMSHHPPGLVIEDESDEGQGEGWQHNIELHVVIDNLGNTPAEVTRSLLQILITDKPLPPDPFYDEANHAIDTHVFLVKDNHFTIHKSWKMDANGIKEIRANPSRWTMYVFGYIDYTDRFGIRHRAGYGRRYEPWMDDRARYMTGGRNDPDKFARRNNLTFILERGYNYDIEITRQGTARQGQRERQP